MVEELTDKNKLSSTILEEIKSDFIELVITFFLKLKKSIYLSLRSIIEHTLMYIYYKDHFIELLQLQEDPSNRIRYDEFFSFLAKHPFYKTRAQQKLLLRLRNEYGRLSEIIHASSYRTFQNHKMIIDFKISSTDFKVILDEIIFIIEVLIIMIILSDKILFDKINSQYKNFILSSISSKIKQIIYS